MLFGEPEAASFLAVVERIKRLQRHKARQTQQAKRRVRSLLRKRRPLA